MAVPSAVRVGSESSILRLGRVVSGVFQLLRIRTCWVFLRDEAGLRLLGMPTVRCRLLGIIAGRRDLGVWWGSARVGAAVASGPGIHLLEQTSACWEDCEFATSAGLTSKSCGQLRIEVAESAGNKAGRQMLSTRHGRVALELESQWRRTKVRRQRGSQSQLAGRRAGILEGRQHSWRVWMDMYRQRNERTAQLKRNRGLGQRREQENAQ